MDSGTATGQQFRSAGSGRRAQALENEDNEHGPPARIAGIYRVKPDGAVEAVESARVEAGEETTMFATEAGIVVVIGAVTQHSRVIDVG